MLYCYKCNVAECEHGPCYYCAKGSDNPDPYIHTIVPPDVNGCPQRYDEYDGISPKWKRVPHPIHTETFYDKRYTWLTDGLNDWLNEHWEEVPKFLQDASCGFLIAPQSFRRLKIIRLMSLFEGAENGRYDSEDVQAEVQKATKQEIINGLIPDVFVAGMIYMAKQVLDGKFIPAGDGSEEDNDEDFD